MLRAYDKKTGKEVGTVFMPAPQTGSPMTYVHNGKAVHRRCRERRPYSANTLHHLALGIGMNFLRLGSTVTLSCALFLLSSVSRAKSQQRGGAFRLGRRLYRRPSEARPSPFITRSVRPVTAIN